MRVPGFQSLPSRLAILLSFYTAILLALPFWLKTTTIERLPLPRQEVADWESRLPCPVRTTQHLTLRLPLGIVKRSEREAVAGGIQLGLRAAGDGVVGAPRMAGSEADGGENSTDSRATHTVEPSALDHAACIDWDVLVGDSGQKRIVAGLCE